MTGVLAGRYHILGKLGEGGMAIVYRAEDTALGRTVAVKVLREQYAADPSLHQRLRDEARIAARLSHPHIVGVLDVGESNGLPFIVMEYVDGPTLKEALSAGPLPIAPAVEIAIQTCEAVASAHANGVVHRDIKPQNTLLRRPSSTQGEDLERTIAPRLPAATTDVKLADFGIARAMGLDSVSDTKHVMGSVHYLSPEQLSGRAATFASDIYSIGVVLYEMLAGHPPFEGETVIGVAMQHIQQRPPSLCDCNAQVKPRLENIVFRAMAKEPRERYSSPDEMAQALREYRDLEEAWTVAVPLPGDKRDPPYGRGTDQRPAAPMVSGPVRLRLGPSGRMWPLLAAVVVLGAGLLALPRTASSPVPSATQTGAALFEVSPSSAQAMLLSATPTAVPPTRTLVPTTSTPLPSATPTPNPPTSTSMPQLTPTPIQGSIVTLPVTALRTSSALLGDARYTYPQATNVEIPEAFSGALAAYGGGGRVVIAPRGWTGEASQGATGNTFIRLHPVGSTGASAPGMRVTWLHSGPAVSEAAPYFEQAARILRQQFGGEPSPPPQGIVRAPISPQLLAYGLPNTSDGLEVNGVAYFKGESIESTFVSMQVTLPPREHELATILLDTFVATNVPK
ncbi:MAG: serine/threonine protein kinase [Chloroflexi bacterium]|nr:serine/threonine protein kinase [Chloroflexota bacterium]